MSGSTYTHWRSVGCYALGELTLRTLRSAETTLSLAVMAAPASVGRCVGLRAMRIARLNGEHPRRRTRGAQRGAGRAGKVPGTRRAHGRGDDREERRGECELAAEAPTAEPVAVAVETCTLATGRTASSALRVQVLAG